MAGLILSNLPPDMWASLFHECGMASGHAKNIKDPRGIQMSKMYLQRMVRAQAAFEREEKKLDAKKIIV